MMSVRRQLGHATALVGFIAAIGATAQTPALPSAQPTVRWRDTSMNDYREHLETLSTLVDTCARDRNFKSCDPSLIGPDDRVAIANGSQPEQRLVRYGWLRVLFSKAEDPDEPAAKLPKPGHVEAAVVDHATTSQLLKDAKQRLDEDLAQSNAPVAAIPTHTQERAVMQQVLAEPEFRDLKPTVRDSVLEKFGNWLNRLFESAANLKARSAWVGRALVWGFILAVCVALVWSLLRLERRWRVHLTPDFDRPAPDAASARYWQLWLDDARKAAASGLWREAIHFLYWAAISRLESRRLWPADRARTPREYLALVALEDPRRPGLSQLTGTFEHFWYGGRAAGEGDYKSAEEIASSLIAGGAPAGLHDLSTAPEGRAR